MVAVGVSVRALYFLLSALDIYFEVYEVCPPREGRAPLRTTAAFCVLRYVWPRIVVFPRCTVPGDTVVLYGLWKISCSSVFGFLPPARKRPGAPPLD